MSDLIKEALAYGVSPEIINKAKTLPEDKKQELLYDAMMEIAETIREKQEEEGEKSNFIEDEGEKQRLLSIEEIEISEGDGMEEEEEELTFRSGDLVPDMQGDKDTISNFFPNEPATAKGFDTSRLIAPPPLNKNIVNVNDLLDDKTVPGSIRVDESGDLQKIFFDYSGIGQDNIRTFDHFVSDRIPKILQSKTVRWGDDKVVQFIFRDLIMPENYYPQMAINREETYSGTLYASVVIRDAKNGKVLNDPVKDTITIGDMPVMVRSKYCNTSKIKDKTKLSQIGFDINDPGAYYIANGLEKIVLIQENLRTNQVNTYAANNEGDLVTKMTCATVTKTDIVELLFEKKTGIINLKYAGSNPQKNYINALIAFRLLGEKVNGGKPIGSTQIWSIISQFIEPKHHEKVASKFNNTFVEYDVIVHTKTVVKYLAEKKSMKNDQQWASFSQSAQRMGGDRLDEISKINKDDAHESHITAALEKIRSTSRSHAGRTIDMAKLPKLSDERKRELLADDMAETLFPQINREKSPEMRIKKKLIMLAYMLARFGLVLAGIRPLDDRDDWGNKRLESAGRKMEAVFASEWNRAINKLQAVIDQDKEKNNYKMKDIPGLFDSSDITKYMFSSFTSNKWGRNKNSTTPVTDSFHRASLAESAAYLTKISTPTAKEVQKPEVRMVHGSQLGFVCPIDTPEGCQCGLVKHKSLTSLLSLERDDTIIRAELLEPTNLDTSLIYQNKTDIYNTFCILNGIPIGWCDGAVTARHLRNMRRQRLIWEDTCIYLHERFNELIIYTNSSRIVRPLLVVDNEGPEPQLVIEKKDLWGKDYETLLSEGAVEYIDALEQGQDSVVIAMSIQRFRQLLQEIDQTRADLESAKEKYGDDSEQAVIIQTNLDNLVEKSKYTHCELDPTSIMGISASLIPLGNHNQGPRLVYQSSMGKQSLGLVHGAISHRMENMKTLSFPTRPFFATQTSKWLGMDEVPAGETVTVAFMAYTGYNQEDAILINEASVQRGLFRYTVYHNYKATNNTSGDTTEYFQKPAPRQGEDPKLYSALNENGIPQEGSKVTSGMYVIGNIRKKTMPDGTEKIENISTALPHGIEGIVDRVLISKHAGEVTVEVKIRQTRIPVRGDKFACYTPDHEVLTEDGWIPIKEVTMDHKVASLNPETHEIEYHKPTERFEYDFDGQLYHIENQQIDLTVTQNHKMYVKKRNSDKYELIEARDICGEKVSYLNKSGEVLANDNCTEDKLVDYKGKVYCLEVPNHILYVRKNGKAVFCGNSRHAQKSTVGRVIAEVDMPYTIEGLRPDIIINPLCIPSRMTLGMILELLGSKAAVMVGERVNATAFRHFTQKGGVLEELMNILKEYGYDKFGYQRMYSGITGEMFESPIYIGPVYYQLLKHLVQFKYRSRGGTGAKSALTRQPVQGKEAGGLRIGEMEKDGLLGHGAMSLVYGRLCGQSDAFDMAVCIKCGDPVSGRIVQGTARCDSCQGQQNVGRVTIPYIYRLLMVELEGASLKTKLKVKRKTNPDDVDTGYLCGL